MNIKKVANLLGNFIIRRLAEIFGLTILFSGLFLFLALVTYSPEDPNFIFPKDTEIKNILGFQGSFVSDLFFQSVGLIAFLIPVTLIITGLNIFIKKDFFLIIQNIFFTILYSISGAFFLTHYYTDAFTLYINGNGGFVGFFFRKYFFKKYNSN